jgi:peptidoglycan/xylan/chitin deacetylase (PgdA/CDA1 family)
LTFDDGYADNVENGLPELKALGLPATVFVTAAPLLRREPLWTAELALLLERTRVPEAVAVGKRWPLGSEEERWSARRGLTRAWAVVPPEEVYPELRRLAESLEVGYGQAAEVIMDAGAARVWREAGGSIGGHTVNHPNLAYQTEEVARRELAEAARLLKETLGERPDSMAYPNCGGLARHHSPRLTEIVAGEGYRVACTSDQGVVRPETHRLALPRVTVTRRLWDEDLLEVAIERARLGGAFRG